jgi:phage-related protein
MVQLIRRKVVKVSFYRSTNGREPVKEWLRRLGAEDMKLVGEELKQVEFGWPLGIPIIRKMEHNLWEVRIRLTHGRLGRVLFTVLSSDMYLLHGFVKKQQKTPKKDLAIAKSRINNLRGTL